MEKEFSKYIRKCGGKDTFSQAGQDVFVLEMLQNKKSGFYFEIGGSEPFESNNTFLLEHFFDWNGYSIEFDSDIAKLYNSKRRNQCIVEDATVFDYRTFFEKSKFPYQLDYLSIDIEPAESTYRALSKIPMNQYRFSVITYEHDLYNSGPEFMIKSRDYLDKLGYKLVVSNLMSRGRDFEDWWVDPFVIPDKVWQPFISNKIEFRDLFDNVGKKNK